MHTVYQSFINQEYQIKTKSHAFSRVTLTIRFTPKKLISLFSNCKLNHFNTVLRVEVLAVTNNSFSMKGNLFIRNLLEVSGSEDKKGHLKIEVMYGQVQNFVEQRNL